MEVPTQSEPVSPPPITSTFLSYAEIISENDYIFSINKEYIRIIYNISSKYIDIKIEIQIKLNLFEDYLDFENIDQKLIIKNLFNNIIKLK